MPAGGWITLDEAINAYIDESQQSVHSYYRLWQMAIRLMQKLGIDFFYAIRTIKIAMNPNFTFDLPPDYLNYSKVGVLNDIGEIIPLKYNDKLTNYAEFSTDRLSKTDDNTLFTLFQFNVPIWYNYWNGSTFNNLYGLPSGAPFVGNFKIDNNAGVILVNQTFTYPYVMLEYVASPDPNQTYQIPKVFKEAMIAGLAWYDIKSIPSKTHVQNSNVGMRRKDFYNERRLAWSEYRPFNLEEAYQWCLENVRLTVKI